MRLSSYIFMMFAITLVFYFFGFQPVINLMNLFNGDTRGLLTISCPSACPNDSDGNPVTTCADSEKQPQVICASQLTIIGTIFLFIGIAGVTSLVLGFSAIYVVALLILMAILNFFVLPIQYILTPFSGDITGIAPQLVLIAFFNTLTVLVVADFARGGT